MSNPQIENGFTRIANEILEALCKVNLSPYESRIFWFLARKTYGHQKKMDRISLSQFSEGTGIEKPNVRRTIRSLVDKRMVMTDKERFNRILYGIQKDYDQWGGLSVETVSMETLSVQTVSAETKNIVSRDNETVSVQTPTKERKKKERVKDEPSPSFNGFTKGNGTSESTLEESFTHFWKSYPIKRGKGTALLAWQRLRPNGDLQAKILAAIEAQIRWREARAGDPNLFTPEWKHPATWLKAMGWEDQVEDGRENLKVGILFRCNRCGTSHPDGEHIK